jgi:hypothetical protein
MITGDTLTRAGLFILAAALYSSVGHAGASGYLAAMALVGMAPDGMRVAALALNVLVATIGTVNYMRAGHFDWRTLLPLRRPFDPGCFRRRHHSSAAGNLQTGCWPLFAYPARGPGVAFRTEQSQVRTGLRAGGRRIRTLGPPSEGCMQTPRSPPIASSEGADRRELAKGRLAAIPNWRRAPAAESSCRMALLLASEDRRSTGHSRCAAALKIGATPTGCELAPNREPAEFYPIRFMNR